MKESLKLQGIEWGFKDFFVYNFKKCLRIINITF